MEGNASVGWRGQWFASLAVSPNTTDRSTYGVLRKDLTWAFELTTHQRMVGRLAVDAGIGLFELRWFNGAWLPVRQHGRGHRHRAAAGLPELRYEPR